MSDIEYDAKLQSLTVIIWILCLKENRFISTWLQINISDFYCLYVVVEFVCLSVCLFSTLQNHSKEVVSSKKKKKSAMSI